MAGRIAGITVKIDGETSSLQKSLRSLDGTLRQTQNNLRDINKMLKLDPGNTTLLTQKQKELEKAIQGTKLRLNELRTAQEGVAKGSDEWNAIQLEIIDTEQQLQRLEREYRNFGSVAAQQVAAVGQKMKDLGGKMAEIGGNLTRKITMPIVAGLGAAVKTTSDFDSAMSEVYATMGDKASEVVEYNGKVVSSQEALRDFARKMGAETAFSAAESAEALNYMALAGYDAETSIKMLPNVLDLAAAGSFDLATASDMVTDTQTAFGISLERTSQMVDEMAKASSTGNTSVQQLGEAFLTVGGLAQELNGGVVTLKDGSVAAVDGVQELEIALVAMANAGVKGGEAGTHMRNMLLKLSSPTAEGTKQLERLGVAVFDDEGKMRSLSDIFGDLNSKLSTMTQQEKINAISDLFNTRDLASAEALLNAIGSNWDTIGEAILDSKGAAQEMANTKLDNLGGQMTILKSAIAELAISIGDTLMPTIRKIVSGVQGLVDKFNSLSPETKELIVQIGLVAAAIGPVLLVGGKLIKGIGTVLTFAPKIKAAITAISAGFNPVILVIGAVIAAGVLLYKNWDKITAWWKSNVAPAFAAGAEDLKRDWESIKTTANNLWNGMKDGWNKVKDGVTNVVESLKPAVQSRLDSIKDAFQRNGGGINGVVSAAWVGIKQYYSDAFNVLNTLTRGKLGEIASKFSSIFSNIIETVRNAIERVKGLFNFSWSLPHIRLPHFRVTPGKPPYGLGGSGYLPSISVDWYKKAYDNPVMFTSPTVLQTQSGYKGFGDGHGAEIVLGLEKLRQLVGTTSGVVINVYSTPGQNVNELADKIQDRFVALAKRRAMLNA